MFDPSVAGRIKLLGLDVDGVLTGNDTWVGEIDGRRAEFKRFDIQDGLGIRLLRGSGIAVAWLTGRESPSTTLRAKELDVDTVVTADAARKVAAFEPVLAGMHLSWSDMAFVGDDLADLPVLQRVALPIAVANARDEIKAVCQYVTSAAGGSGAVREVIDGLLRSRGEYDLAVRRFFATGDNAA